MNRFIVILTENSNAWSPKHFGHMFIEGLQRDGDEWEVYNVAKGDLLPSNILEYKGVVITGSHFNIKDRDTLPWFNSLCEVIQTAADVGSPRIYGGCFGCQIVAHALGGEIEPNSSGKFILKAETIRVKGSKLDEYSLADLKSEWNLISSHGYFVKHLPPNSSLIGGSETCEHEAFLCGKHNSLLAFQSHPEFELQYAVYDRIWKAVVEDKKLLSEEDLAIAKSTFAAYSGDDAKHCLQLISNFLHN